jgi:hypothetical protein
MLACGTRSDVPHFQGVPRFFFHVLNDIDAADEEGQELPSLAAANLQAIDYVRDLAASAVRQGRLNLTHRINVEDEQGHCLLSVTFGDAVEISR